MIELKAYRIKVVTLGDFHDVYIKSEADKVIAHQKYKRCMAMAKWCVNGEYKLKRVKMRDMNNHQFWQFDTGYWKKWHKRWLEIAEKFKTKSTAQRAKENK